MRRHGSVKSLVCMSPSKVIGNDVFAPLDFAGNEEFDRFIESSDGFDGDVVMVSLQVSADVGFVKSTGCRDLIESD